MAEAHHVTDVMIAATHVASVDILRVTANSVADLGMEEEGDRVVVAADTTAEEAVLGPVLVPFHQDVITVTAEAEVAAVLLRTKEDDACHSFILQYNNMGSNLSDVQDSEHDLVI